MSVTGPLYALLSFAVFATHDAVIKFLGASYSPIQIIFFVTLFSFPLVTLMLMAERTEGHLRPVHPWWSLARTLCTTIAGFAAFYAFTVLPLAQVYVLLFASPLLITLLSIPMLGEKVGPHRLIAVLVGLCGVIVVLRPGAAELSLGHLAGAVAAVFGATAALIVRKIGSEERTAVLMLYPMVSNFVVMGAILAFVYKPMPVAHLGGLGVVAVLSFVGGLVLIAAYRKADAAIVAPMQYSQILWATLYGFLFFDEGVDGYTLAGAGIIIASGIYIVIRETRLGAASQAPITRTRSRGATTALFRISPLLKRKRQAS
ncbi:DMT family transporter [Sinisalibacter aestuarii]|uniref:Membrane protein n=1 Tax=Sinisalibacter aestuarii TaxID=2949426 RepID=A0ABQ5LPY9_9RHOB|nr:DMT family transporter [Sinisalibacter aestuarii]GKY86351.1 membrane protein [Sinisalibacter aestuarii]